MTGLITLAVGLAVGVPLGAWLRLRLLCSPTCRKHGVWLWTLAQAVATWEGGVTVGVAYERGELTGPDVERVRVLLAGRRERGDLLTAEQFGRVCQVGRQRRIDAGTLRGHAAGEPDPIQVQVSLLDDLLAVFPNGEDKAWGETLCERLAAYRAELYGGWRTATLTEALKALGVPQRQVNKRAGDDHDNKRGFALEDIAKAAEAR